MIIINARAFIRVFMIIMIQHGLPMIQIAGQHLAFIFSPLANTVLLFMDKQKRENGGRNTFIQVPLTS